MLVAVLEGTQVTVDKKLCKFLSEATAQTIVAALILQCEGTDGVEELCAETIAKLKAAADRVLGNRPRDQSTGWSDRRLGFAAFLREALKIIGEAE